MQDNKPVCCSGGAEGADILWGNTAHKAGHDVIHFIFPGHRSEAPRDQLYMLTNEQLELANPHLEYANKTLKRSWPVRNYFTANLLRRNYYQVQYSDSLYAVSQIGRDQHVKGGTAWAVTMFLDIHPGKPCYVFDQKKENWFQWKGAWLPCLPPPTPSGVYAAVGSRDLLQAGHQAILGLF